MKNRFAFGGDTSDKMILAEDGSVERVEIALPDDAKLDPNGKGLGVELQFVAKHWGANKPLKCTVSPIEIK